jgi:hypothetical protein
LNITFCFSVDVVQAYKGLQKEKSALEKSLRVLGTSGKVAPTEKDSDESVQDSSGNTVKESATDGAEIPQAQHLKPEVIRYKVLVLWASHSRG